MVDKSMETISYDIALIWVSFDFLVEKVIIFSFFIKS